MTPTELAAKTNVAERYACEYRIRRLLAIPDYDPAARKFALPPEQAMVFADVDSPVYLQGAFDLALAMVENQPKVEGAFRSGKGVGWGDQAQCLFCTVGRFFRPGYHNNLRLPGPTALDGVAAKLESGAKGLTLVVTGFRPSSWRRRSRSRLSSVTTFTLTRLSRRGSTPSSTEQRRTQSSKSPWRAIFQATTWTW